MTNDVKEARDVVIVTPVLNDWPCLAKLVSEIDALPELADRRVTFVAVDDGSTSIDPPSLNPGPGCVEEVRIVQLNANQGHQRAIALGLAHVYETWNATAIIAMDSDGEDLPADIPRLIAASKNDAGALIVARRERRSEGVLFVFFYQIYKLIFAFLTGKSISFGNFSLIPGGRLPNILFYSGIWNNLAATLLRSRLPIIFVGTNRGERYYGSSTMNFTSLMLHGMSAISVFTDMVIGRIILFLTTCCILAAAAIAAIVALKFGASMFVPGYATYVILFVINLLALALFTGFVSILGLLASRDQAASVPTELISKFVREVLVIRSDAPEAWTAVTARVSAQ